MAKVSRSKAVWPCPVYVATFAGGEEIRCSSWQQRGKPFDFARARRGVCQVIGGERGRATIHVTKWAEARFANASDQISGHFEHDGMVYPDPLFAGEAVPVAVSTKADPVLRLIASLNKLDWAQLETVQAAIDERLAA